MSEDVCGGGEAPPPDVRRTLLNGVLNGISGTGHVCQESACPWNCTGTWGTASWQCPQYDDDGCIMFQVCASSSAS